jgi:hypothetical protein
MCHCQSLCEPWKAICWWQMIIDLRSWQISCISFITIFGTLQQIKWNLVVESFWSLDNGIGSSSNKLKLPPQFVRHVCSAECGLSFSEEFRYNQVTNFWEICISWDSSHTQNLDRKTMLEKYQVMMDGGFSKRNSWLCSGGNRVGTPNNRNTELTRTFA